MVSSSPLSPLSPPNLTSLAAILLMLVFWYLLPSAKSQELCPKDLPHVIYAADNLPNGTIRLYSDLHYWDLELYYEPEKENSWWSPFAKLFLPKPKLLVDSDGLHLNAFIDDRNREKRLISSVYHGLNFNLHDNKTFSHVTVSFSDWKRSNYTYLFETNNGSSSSSAMTSTGRFLLWNATSGRIVKSYDINLDQSSDVKLFITGAFNVILNETQHLFLLMNRKFFIVNYLDSNKLHPVLDVDKLYHRGNIPHPISASFTIQASADQIWIVLIHCSHFCLVPWNSTEKFFDFNKCSINDPSWKSLEPFFSSDGNDYPDKKLFQSYSLLQNLTQLTNITVDFENESSPFLDDRNTETPWTLISKYFFTILIVLVLVFSVVVLYFAIDRQHSASYNLAKKEEEAKKRLEMKGINDADKNTKGLSAIEVAEKVKVTTTNQTAQNNELVGEFIAIPVEIEETITESNHEDESEV